MTGHETVGSRLATSLGPDLEWQGDQWVLLASASTPSAVNGA